MKKSVSKRIRITRTGKVLHRPMGVGHFKVRKSKRQKAAADSTRGVFVGDYKNMQRELNRTFL